MTLQPLKKKKSNVTFQTNHLNYFTIHYEVPDNLILDNIKNDETFKYATR